MENHCAHLLCDRYHHQYACCIFRKRTSGSYLEAKRQGFFLTAHAGEDGSDQNIWDALLKLHVDRIDHGCRAAENPQLMQYLTEHDILLAMCPYGNVLGGAAKSFEEHPFKTLLHAGVPVSISTDVRHIV